MEKEKTGVIGVAFKLFIICFVSTLLLSCTNYLTKDIIAENDIKAFEEGCLKVVPDGTEIKNIEFAAYLEGAEAALVYDANGNELGLAIKQTVSGYNPGIVILTGVSKDGNTVLGIDILDHSETPGLGAKADSDGFTKQFENKAYPVKSNKDGGEIVAITGATRTTNGVIDSGVNKAVEAAKAYYEAKEGAE